MANPHKGEYRLSIEDKDYVLRYSADTICDLEEQLDMTLSEMSDRMQKPESMRMSMVRAMFCAGLSDRHADLDDPARRTLFKALSPVDAVRHVASAFMLAFGIEPSAEGAANPPSPGEAQNGTGPASTATGAG